MGKGPRRSAPGDRLRSRSLVLDFRGPILDPAMALSTLQSLFQLAQGFIIRPGSHSHRSTEQTS